MCGNLGHGGNQEAWMKSVEFEAKLDSDANLKVPDELVAQLPTDQLLRTYADGDAIYDNV